MFCGELDFNQGNTLTKYVNIRDQGGIGSSVSSWFNLIEQKFSIYPLERAFFPFHDWKIQLNMSMEKAPFVITQLSIEVDVTHGAFSPG
ncbi:MAG TPA: hypothetical protein DCF33_22515 [Saprospirales bacterium]|nr:hypothetical protein [Saprospirales bacterium]